MAKKQPVDHIDFGSYVYEVPAPEPTPQSNVGRPKISGKSGMGICEFMFSLLVMNETKKFTDGQLLSIMRQEYAELPDVLARLDRISAVASHRSKYNVGSYGPIALYSFRYNEHGQPLRRGNRNTFTIDEQRELVEAKGIPDDRFKVCKKKPPRKPRRKN